MYRLERGLLIVVEGIDGAGKTTQVARLSAAFRDAGLDVVASKEPTDGPWGRVIRESASSGRLSLEEELDAFVNDRREHVERVINPALERGAIVFVDRYYVSTAAYQGARGGDIGEIIARNEKFAPAAHVLVIIDVPVDVGLRRVERRDGAGNLFEEPGPLEQSRRLFLGLAKTLDAHVVDGGSSVEAVTKEIAAAILDRIGDHLPPHDTWMAGANLSPAAEAVGEALRALGAV